jgi:type IV pilus assembly protein PilM
LLKNEVACADDLLLGAQVVPATEVRLVRGTRIGLDIGSSAVRAAEVSTQRDGPEMVRFAQVGLPGGAVVEGEVRDQAAVSGALRRLWLEGGFDQREVVLGISSQRSMVRVVEMPKLEATELASAVRYQMTELLPIGVEESVFDFEVLGRGKACGEGGETLEVLLVVAQREIVLDHINVVRKAGLRVRAVDSSPLALLRGLSLAGGKDLEAVVSLGANLVVVAVREGMVPRFVRTVALAGHSASVPNGEGSVVGKAQPAAGRDRSRLTTGDGLEPTVEEVRGSLEYFHSHSHEARLERVLLTGGGALAPGMGERLSAALGMPVVAAEPSFRYDLSRLGLTRGQVENASARWVAVAGLALWGWGDFAAPSLVPAEVRERRQFERGLIASAAGLVALAGGLGIASYHQARAAARVAREVAAAHADAATLQRQIDSLQPSTAIQSELRTRAGLAETALSGDIGWVGLVDRIDKALPPGVTIGNLSVARVMANPTGGSAVSGTGTTSVSSLGADDIGEVSMALTGSGGPRLVAEFVQRMWDVPGIYALWVSNTSTVGSGKATVTSFSATAQLTTRALSGRGARIPGVTR